MRPLNEHAHPPVSRGRLPPFCAETSGLLVGGVQDGICTFVVRTGGQQVEQRVAVGTEQTFNEYLLRCLPPS